MSNGNPNTRQTFQITIRGPSHGQGRTGHAVRPSSSKLPARLAKRLLLFIPVAALPLTLLWLVFGFIDPSIGLKALIGLEAFTLVVLAVAFAIHPVIPITLSVFFAVIACVIFWDLMPGWVQVILLVVAAVVALGFPALTMYVAKDS